MKRHFARCWDELPSRGSAGSPVDVRIWILAHVREVIDLLTNSVSPHGFITGGGSPYRPLWGSKGSFSSSSA